MEHGEDGDAEHAFEQPEVERFKPAQAIGADRHGQSRIDQVKEDGYGFGGYGSDGGSLDAEGREAGMAENEQVVEDDVGNGHAYRVQGKHLGAGDTDKKGAEHHANEREKEAEDTPIQEFFGSVQQGIRGNQDPEDVGSEEAGKEEEQGGQNKEEKDALYHDGAYLVVPFFTVAAGDDDLRAGAETESDGESADIVESAHGGSAEFDLADASEEGGVGDVDYVLRQQSEKDGVAYLADLFVGVHRLLLFLRMGRDKKSPPAVRRAFNVW